MTVRRRAAVAAVLVALSLATAPLPASAQDPEAPALSAAGAVLWDPADERVLHGADEEHARPMASTTKIMTTLLALEAGAEDEVLTVSANAAAAREASLGLRTGARYPMRSVLAGLMLRSGNDAAIAVAEHVAGSEAAFVAKMNARAAELGLDDTRFVNASGLTNDPTHAASPRDLAELASVALEHPDFARWAAAERLAVAGLGTLESRNLLLGDYPGANGVKTGNTALAGWCLVASATRDGRTLVSVVLGSPTQAASYADTRALLDYGFSVFRRAAPAVANATVTSYRWADASVPLVAADTLAATVRRSATVTWRTALRATLPRPAAPGTPAGSAQLIVEGRVLEEVPLRTAAAAPAPAPAPADVAVGRALHDAVRTFSRLYAADRAA